MTSTKAILGTVAGFIALIVVTAYGSMVAALMGRMHVAEALHHASWMFVLAGGMCAAAGLAMALTVALINEVRTARSVGQRSAKTLHGHHAMTAGAVRRVSSSQPALAIRE